MILSFSFEGCFLFFFRSSYRFFYDRIRKTPAHEGGSHKVAAAIGQLFHIAALHQSGSGFQLRAFAVLIRGIDAFQCLLDLRTGKTLLPQVLGRRTAALADIAVGPGGVVEGKEVKMEVAVGNKVIYSKYAGTEVKLDGEEYIIVKQSDILAIVE